MSEENVESLGTEKVRVKITGDPIAITKFKTVIKNEKILRAANEELVSELDDVTSKANLMAQHEFDNRLKTLTKEGYDTSEIETPEQLKMLELVSQKYKDESYDRGSGAPLTEAQITGKSTNEEGSYDSVEQMITDLQSKASADKTNYGEADKVLDALTLKVLKAHHDRPLIDLTIEPKDLADFHKKQNAELRKYHVKKD